MQDDKDNIYDSNPNKNLGKEESKNNKTDFFLFLIFEFIQILFVWTIGFFKFCEKAEIINKDIDIIFEILNNLIK